METVRQSPNFIKQISRIQNLFFGLRGTLLVTFVLLSIATIGMVVLVGILLSTRTSQNLVFDELTAEIELHEQAINNWLDERQHDLAVIVNNPGDIEQTRSVLSNPDNVGAYADLLKRLQVETGPTSRFEEIFLLDQAGQVVLSTDEDNLGKIHKNQSYFQKSLLAPLFSLAHNENEIIVTVPVRDKFGGVIGVLVGRLNVSELARLILTRAASTETGETYLVSQDHHFLTQPRFNPNSITIYSEGVERALTPGPDRNGQGIYQNYNGVSVVGAYRWLPEIEVVLLAERAEDEALAGARQLVLVSTAVAVAVLFIATGIALFVTSRIIRPISTLTEAATAIAEGELNRSVTVTAHNEIGLLAQAFNTMTGRLRNLIDTLEDRVEERTRALKTGAEISRQITAILNIDKLLQYVVDHIQTEFDFYHTHIYLLEAESGNLVMAYGFGEVGRQLKEQGHILLAGQGIVGTVVGANQHFLSNNVKKALNFVRNPLLPHTNSELAVPLRKGDQTLGVLDIQSEQVDRFALEDISLMQSLANQVAVAIDNVRLLAETQAALQKVERLNRHLTREAWEEFTTDIETRGYRFKGGTESTVISASDAWLPPMKQAVTTRQLVKQTRSGNGDNSETELAVPLMLRGEVIGVLGVKREETPEWAEEEVSAVEAVANQVARALENARLASEQKKTIVQLKEVDRLKSEFLTSMSHELRTPLNSIIGFADVLLQGIDGELNDLATNDIQLIYNSGQHLLALINDILDISKIEAGMMELVPEVIDVKDTFNDVLAASRSLVKNKPVDIVTEIPDQLPLIYVDKLRIHQVLLNLVSNAAKFTHEGKITIKATSPDPMADKMSISVVDMGIGIPENKLETIFDRFRQADSSTTREYGGSGLGLAICRQLVEMHGGELNVTSEENVGSEFYFTIPLAIENIPEE